MRNGLESDLADLCKGWTAVYEIWPIHEGSNPIAKIQTPIDTEDIALSIRGYLDKISQQQIKLPCSIRADIMAFTVLHRLYVVSKDLGVLQCVSQRVPLEPTPKTSHYLYSQNSRFSLSYGLTLCPNGRYVAYWSKDETEKQTVKIFRYKSQGNLVIRFLRDLQFCPSPRMITHAAFHPTLAILAFSRSPASGSFWTDYTDDPDRTVMWQFLKRESEHIKCLCL